MGVEGEAGSLLDNSAVAACSESDAEVDNTGQDEEGGSCRQVEGAALGSAVSHRGEDAKEEEREEGRTERRSPFNSGCVVCNKTPLNRTEVVVDEKLGMLELVGLRESASPEEEGWEVKVWISGRPPSSGVVSSFMGRNRPWLVSAWIKGDDVVVLLISLVRDLSVVVVVLYEKILLPPSVFALVNVGVVVLTPSSGLIPPRTPSVFVLE